MNLRFQTVSMVFIFALFTACSPNGKIDLRGIDLSTRQVGASTYVDMEGILVLGNLKLPNMEVPILNPNTMRSLGQLSLQSLADGTNSVKIEIDFDEAMRLDPTLGKTLPNGRELPAELGVGSNTIVGIPVKELSRVYVGGDLKKDIYMGTAISIPALDTVLNQAGMPLNIFFSYPFSPEVHGTAGIYTSSQPGQNGIGIFVKKSMLPHAPSKSSAVRALASVDAAPTLPEGGEEISHLDAITILRLDHLLDERATLRVK